MTPYWTSPDGRHVIYCGDCLDVMETLDDGSVDCIVTDPPYGIEFMGKEWDSIGGGRTSKPGIGQRDREWVSNRGWNPYRCVKCGHLPHGGSPCQCEQPDVRACDNRWARLQDWYFDHFSTMLRVLKPGGYLLSFGGTRTYHRLTCAIEDAGFEVRDCLMWLYGQGFPKGQGNLKPAYEPILLARRPGKKVLPLGIDECRIPTNDGLAGGRVNGSVGQTSHEGWQRPWMSNEEAKNAHVERSRESVQTAEALGRYPANVVHDGSEDILDAFAAFGESKSSAAPRGGTCPAPMGWGQPRSDGHIVKGHTDSGSPSRFFYCAKPSQEERNLGLQDLPLSRGVRSNAPRQGEDQKTKPRLNNHPTVKPVALMQWLIRLVCPPEGTVLDPFLGSGTTGVACFLESRSFVGIEQDLAYLTIAQNRIIGSQRDLPLLAHLNTKATTPPEDPAQQSLWPTTT